MTIDPRLDGVRYSLQSIVLCLALSPSARAQFTNATQSEPNTLSSGLSGQLVALNGVVLNANTNQPVGRALVRAGSHAILTGHDGKFQFTEESGSSTSLRVIKPGFYEGLDPNSTGKRVTFGSTVDPVTAYLYPEALITGTMNAPNGDPLGGVYIQALRKSGDESGSTWTMAGQTSTNADGQFRLPLDAGDYVLETHYMFDRPVRKKAVLPAMVPEFANSTGAQPAIHLESGTEQHLDLRPEVHPVHEVHIQLDGASSQSFPAIEAHLGNGLSFFPASRPGGAPGEFITSLPQGSYTLTVSTNERGAVYAQTTVTVADTDVSGVTLQTIRSIPVPVEVLVDNSASSATTSDNLPPSAQQLGLRFIRTDRGGPTTDETVFLRTARGEAASFTLTPGRYRLFAQPLSHWFIESATIGGTDLLTQEFDVESGGGSAPLRIVVSSNTAALKGTVRLDGKPGGSCWVYLIAAPPGITPVILAQSGSDGTFSRSSVSPGSYRALAFETHQSGDFTDPATLARFASYMRSLTIAPGEVGSLDLDAVPVQELKH